MEELYLQLVKSGPGWTVVLVIGLALASALFLIFNRQYAKIRREAHDEALKLKEGTISDQRVRIAELEVEKNEYKEKSHLNANIANKLSLDLAECRSKPSVEALASILKEFKAEQKESREAQIKVNLEILEALKQLNEDLRMHVEEKRTIQKTPAE